MAGTSYIRQDDDDGVRFVQSQHTQLDFYRTSSLLNNSQWVDMSLHSHIYNSDSEPTSLCSYSLMLRVYQRSSKYQL